jgi:hypothetical protein
MAETAKLIFTVSEQMARLAKEDERSQGQILELTKMVFDLAKSVASMTGQMMTIEKRLEDKDKLMEMMIAVRVREEVEKAITARVREEVEKALCRPHSITVFADEDK